MTIQTSIYAGGAFANGGEPALSDIAGAGYTSLIMWSVHVNDKGTLILNDTTIVEVDPGTGKSVYTDNGMDLPQRLAALRNRGMKIGFSVGSGGWQGHPNRDFTHIFSLMGNGIPGPGNVIYDNFATLLAAMQSVSGGGIDFIDFDFEDDGNILVEVITNFAIMLGNVGYPNVTFCPSFPSAASNWQTALTNIIGKKGAGFVSALNVQFYSGGLGNTLSTWANVISATGSKAALIPGLSTNNPWPGPWWDQNAAGNTVVKTANVAQYGKGDWSGKLRVASYPGAAEAMQKAGTQDTFFFYCRGPLDLGPGKRFNTGDAVYFTGALQWGSAPQADGYALSGPTQPPQNYDQVGGCPSDFRTQFAAWKSDPNAPQGGFVWLYDSVLSTELTNSCGGSEMTPTATAKAYREAISNGLG